MTVTRIDPRRHDVVLFDLDGVLTDTTALHAAAWKRLFDEFLAARPADPSEDHRTFTDTDYLHHVDGKPRIDGVLDFLASRNIQVPRGSADDEPGERSGHGLGKLKDRYFQELLEFQGAQAFEDATALVRSLRDNGLRTAVVSASRNCADVLERSGMTALFDVLVDGVLADELQLPGKPDPAAYLEAAALISTPPTRCVVIEDAESGVHAARAGGFGLAIGLARTGEPDRLLEAGADAVVSTLADIIVTDSGERRLSELPDALTGWDEIAGKLRGTLPALLLDFDGTLAPIRDDPSSVSLPIRTRMTLVSLARRLPVAIISGRDLWDVRRRVRVDTAWYAGSHGFEIAGPGVEPIEQSAATPALADLDEAERHLRSEFAAMPGVLVDRKRFALAVHYRNATPDDAVQVMSTAHRVSGRLPTLRIAHGRRVVELLPDVDWDKGRALRWLLTTAGLPETTPVFAGDDYTDEDALREVQGSGIGIVVLNAEHGDRLTWAHYSVSSPASLRTLLGRIASLEGPSQHGSA